MEVAELRLRQTDGVVWESLSDGDLTRKQREILVKRRAIDLKIAEKQRHRGTDER